MLIVVETFLNPGEPSASPVRVRPLKGQFSEDYRVWCSKALRTAWAINSLFLVSASFVVQERKKTHLRIAMNEPWQLIDRRAAMRHIATQFNAKRVN